MKRSKTLILLVSVFLIIIFVIILWPKKIAQTEPVLVASIPAPTPEKKVDIFVAGDIMLDRSVRSQIDKFGPDHIFASTTDTIKGADVSFANLEGVVTNFDSVSAVNHDILRFTFDPAVLDILKSAGFKAFSQANNHDNDFGSAGIDQSFNYLKGAGLQVFGDYFNKDGKVATFNKNGFDIALIGYNEFGGTVDHTLDLIKNYKAENYFVIVMPHWGIEYQDYPTDFQKETAKKMIDIGADIIVGAHPHVVESVEVYKNKPIFYSLGNFVFDQNFSYGTTHSIVLKIEKTESKEKITILPIALNNSVPSFMDGADNQKMLDFLASISDDSLKQQIQSGEIDL